MAKKHHLTLFGKVFGSLWDFLKSAFEAANHGLLETLIIVTNKVKELLNSGVVDIVTAAIPGHLDDKLAGLLRDKLPKILESEILLKAALDKKDLTPTEGQETVGQITDVWAGFTDADRAEFYTTLGAKLYIHIQQQDQNETVTFGEAASFIEAAWKAWWKENKDKAAV